jgi:uncharacterized membrane protein
MTKGRVEALSDAVIAIAITIMVLELQAPSSPDVRALSPLIPQFLSYLLSFTFLGIYWSNHHHLFQAVQLVDGATLWANLHLLFWLSLVPFVTGWVGESGLAPWPAALYGIILLMASFAYFLLTRHLIRLHGPQSTMATAVGRDAKGKISLILYALAIPLAFASPAMAMAIYVGVAILWIVPDRRFERRLAG